MPLLSPSQIHQTLRAIDKSAPKSLKPAEENPLENKLQVLLESQSLGVEEILMNLSSLMRSAESDSVRTRAAELALRLHGFLQTTSPKDQVGQQIVQIVIQDRDFTEVNPILIPRT